MATLATGYPIRESAGSTTLLIWKFSSIATSDSYATGLTAGMVGYWMTITSGMAVATTSGAWQVSESSGTLTFTSSGGPGTAIAATVYGLATI